MHDANLQDSDPVTRENGSIVAVRGIGQGSRALNDIFDIQAAGVQQG